MTYQPPRIWQHVPRARRGERPQISALHAVQQVGAEPDEATDQRINVIVVAPADERLNIHPHRDVTKAVRQCGGHGLRSSAILTPVACRCPVAVLAKHVRATAAVETN